MANHVCGKCTKGASIYYFHMIIVFFGPLPRLCLPNVSTDCPQMLNIFLSPSPLLCERHVWKSPKGKEMMASDVRPYINKGLTFIQLSKQNQVLFLCQKRWHFVTIKVPLDLPSRDLNTIWCIPDISINRMSMDFVAMCYDKLCLTHSIKRLRFSHRRQDMESHNFSIRHERQ